MAVAEALALAVVGGCAVVLFMGALRVVLRLLCLLGRFLGGAMIGFTCALGRELRRT